jgi:heterodisulfide reductase subunit C2
MAIIISKKEQTDNLLKTVEEISGVNVSTCLQCKKCSNGCPVTKLTKVSPSEIIRRLQLNVGKGLLKSDLIWMCASCETCYSRCPMNINMASVMDALRKLSVRNKASRKNGRVNKFNKAFLNSVRMFGRTYDLGMIASFKLKTSSYMQDVDKFPMMLKKGKIALLPSFKANKKYIKRIFKRKDKDK